MPVKRSTSIPSWSLTIFRVNKSIRTWNKALSKTASKDVAHETVKGVGTLVIKQAQPRAPWWASALGESFPKAKEAHHAHASCALFVKSDGQLFAFTFGHGRWLLDPSAIDHDFGIKAVLNQVDPEQLRSIDHRTLEERPLVLRKQSGSKRNINAFNLDQSRDILKAVAGYLPDKTAVAGSDAFHVREKIQNLKDLVGICKRANDAAKRDDYRKNFAFVDDIRFVRDPAIKVELWSALHKAATASKTEGLFFAPPDIVEGHELGELVGNWKPADFLSDDSVRETIVEIAKKSTSEQFFKAVRKRRVGSLDAAGPQTFLSRWPLDRCLIFESDRAQRKYVLAGGDWYEVEQEFIKRIEREFDSLAETTHPLPAATGNQNERDYNIYAAKATGFCNLDTTSLSKGVGVSAVEPCDLLDTQNGSFFHVKDGRRSSNLSHLFNQGLVSLLMLTSNATVVDTLRSLVTAKNATLPFVDAPINASKSKVVFAIIDKQPKNNGSWRLPFFSMITATNTAKRIRELGARVAIVRIDDNRQ